MLRAFKKAGNTYAQDFRDIEAQAQQWWTAEAAYKSAELPDRDNKRYILGMFPYPSGNAHMGHVRVYSITDIMARHARFKGREVLHPLGWDSFGLPAENAAFKNKVHPADWTNANIATMRDEQIGRVGFSFDLGRELATSSPEYYKWTQWLFLKLYEHGKVYRSFEWVNWDPVDKTVLANEQVIDGKGWRSGVPIERRQMEQWFIRITDYAEDLAKDLETLEGWSDAAKGAQRNWIGRAEGALINFPVVGQNHTLPAFTTRPELAYGITAIVVAPENEEILKLCTPMQRAYVADYIKQALLKPEVERASGKPQSGIFTGIFAKHPLTGQQLPVYVADYVLNTYANGIAPCIPAHNERDHQFSTAMNVPVKSVVQTDPSQKLPYTETIGTLNDSANFDGMALLDARRAITEHLEQTRTGQAKIEYRLRDWSLSRQRFWGSPIPMLRKADGSWETVPHDQLPVELPRDADFSDEHGRSPLATNPDFHQVRDPATGEVLERETDTMDTFMCSAWYAWRFTDPQNTQQAWDPQKGNAWMPIDTYVGGLEHANQHMIYFRFMSHFLHDIGLTDSKEPIRVFLDNGLVRMHGEKMSKSKGNIVRPDEMVEKFGADALRMYILSDVPFNRDVEWSEEGLGNKFDFLKRINGLYRNYAQHAPHGPITLTAADVQDEWSAKLLIALQDMADKTDADIEKTHNFHNVVARTHEFANRLFQEQNNLTTTERNRVYAYAMQGFLKVLSLTAPHLADTLYRDTFATPECLFKQPWIEVEPELLKYTPSEIKIPVMVGGKKRGEIALSPAANDDDIKAVISGTDNPVLRNAFNGSAIGNIIVVRDAKTTLPKLANVVLLANRQG